MSTQSDGPSTPSFPAPPSNTSDGDVTRPPSAPPALDMFAPRRASHEEQNRASTSAKISAVAKPAASQPLPGARPPSTRTTASAAPTSRRSARPSATQPSGARPTHAASADPSHGILPAPLQPTGSLALPHRPHLTILTSMSTAAKPSRLSGGGSSHASASSASAAATAPVATLMRHRSMSSSSHTSGGHQHLDPAQAAITPPNVYVPPTQLDSGHPSATAPGIVRSRSDLRLYAGGRSRAGERSASSLEIDAIPTSDGSDAATDVLMGVALPAARHGEAPRGIDAPPPAARSGMYAFDSAAVGAASSRALSHISESRLSLQTGTFESHSMGINGARDSPRFSGFPRAASYGPSSGGRDEQGEAVLQDGAQAPRPGGRAVSWGATARQQQTGGDQGQGCTWQRRAASGPREGLHGGPGLDWQAGVPLTDDSAHTPGRVSARSQLSAAMDHLQQSTPAASEVGGRPAASSSDDDGAVVDDVVPLWKVRLRLCAARLRPVVCGTRAIG